MTPLDLIERVFEIAVCGVASIMVITPIVLVVNQVIQDIRAGRRP